MRQGGQQQIIPMYFINEREKFLQQAQGMGCDMYAVADFLD